MSEITIRVDGQDITSIVLFRDCEFTSAANGTAGTATVRVSDPAYIASFRPGQSLTLDIDGARQWSGWVMTVRRGFHAAVVPTRDICEGLLITPRVLTIEGVDLNFLFSRRYVYDKANPVNTLLARYPPDTTDAAVLADLFANYIDLAEDGLDLSTKVAAVGTVGIFVESAPLTAGASWAEAMATISRIPAAVYYIDPDRYLVYADVDDPTDDTVFTDRPSGPNHVGVRELEITHDATKMINDALVWGTALGVSSVTFARSTDEESIAAHGRWQRGDVATGLYTPEYVAQRADSFVYGSPTGQRGGKDPRQSVQFTVFDRPVRVADRYEVRSDVFGFSNVLPIRQVTMSFPTPSTVRYSVLASHEIDLEWRLWESRWELPTLPTMTTTYTTRIANPAILRVLDSFTRTNIPTYSLTECTDHPGWGQGERLTWATPVEPGNAYLVKGGRGIVRAAAAEYRTDNLDEGPYRELTANLPDQATDLRNILVKFRLGRWERVYGQTNTGWSTLGIEPIVDGEKAFDLAASGSPDTETFARALSGSSNEVRTFSATPIVPPGGAVTKTVLLGSTTSTAYSTSCLPSDSSGTMTVEGFTSGAGGGILPHALRQSGCATASGAVTSVAFGEEPVRLNTYSFVGIDPAGATYPWQVDFWLTYLGHQLRFTRNNAATYFYGATVTSVNPQRSVSFNNSFYLEPTSGGCMEPITNAQSTFVTRPITGLKRGDRPKFYNTINGTGIWYFDNDSPQRWNWEYRAATGMWRATFEDVGDGGFPPPLDPGISSGGPDSLFDIYLGDPAETDIIPYPGTWGYGEEMVPPPPVIVSAGAATDYHVSWSKESGYTTQEVDLSLSPDQDYWLRIFVDDNNSMNAKIWPVGSIEPIDFPIWKRTTASGGAIGAATSLPLYGFDKYEIAVGAAVFPYQTYAIEVDLIATAKTSGLSDSVPTGSTYVCESLSIVTIASDPGEPTSLYCFFRTSQPYIWVGTVSVFGMELTKGTHWREVNSDTGLIEIFAGVADPSGVAACYYTQTARVRGTMPSSSIQPV